MRPDRIIFSNRHRVVIALVLILSFQAEGQQYWESDQLSGAGARARSMADAYGTEVTDISAMFWNPASPALLERHQILFSALHAWNGQAIRGVIAAPFRLSKTSSLGLALSGTRVSFPTEDMGRLLGQHVSADLVSATELTSTLAAGVGWRLQHGRTSRESMWVSSFSGGLLYAPSPEISYALVYSNVGSGARIVSDTLMPSSLAVHKEPLGSLLHMSIAMRFPSSRLNRIITLILANEKEIGERGIRYRGAFEVLVIRSIALRAGYIVTPAMSGARYGLGVMLDPVQIDYAVSPAAGRQQFHELTLMFGLNADSRTTGSEFGWGGDHDNR